MLMQLRCRLSNIVGRLDLNLLIILLVSLGSWCINTYSFNSPASFDPWYFVGYFLNLQDLLRDFSWAYQGSRLSWILPGYAAYQMFPPAIANYLLDGLLYYVCTFSIYFILKQLFSARVGLVVSVLIGFYSFFLFATGWDYVDGAGIAYYLLTFLFLTWAGKTANWKIPLFCSGISLTCLIVSNLFWITFIPNLVLYYFLINSKYRKNPILPGILIPALSSLLVFLIFCFITYRINGQFNFIYPQFSVATRLATYDSNANPIRNFIEFSASTWYTYPFLQIHITIFALSLLSLFKAFLRKINLLKRVENKNWGNEYNATLLQLNLVISFIVVVIWRDTYGQPLLASLWYVSVLIPATFLALGSQILGLVDRLSRKHFFILLTVIVGVSLCSYKIRLPEIISSEKVLILLACTITILSIFLLIRRVGESLSISVLALVSILVMNWITIPANAITREQFQTNRDSFIVVTQFVRMMQALEIRPANLLLWYSSEDPEIWYYRAIHRTYLITPCFSESLPRITSKELGVLKTLLKSYPGSKKLVILSHKPTTYRKAVSEIEAAGYSVRLRDQKVLREGGVTLDLYILDMSQQGDRMSQQSDGKAS